MDRRPNLCTDCEKGYPQATCHHGDDALELLMRESDQKLRELATAFGLKWEGKGHIENVTAALEIRASHAELASSVGTAIVAATLRPGESLAVKTDHAIVAAVETLRRDRDAMWAALLSANNALFDVAHLDVEHEIDCHADSIPLRFRTVAAAANAALEALRVVIREKVGG